MNLCLPYGVFIYFGKINEALGGQGGQGELGECKGVGVNGCVKRGLRRGFKKKGGFCTWNLHGKVVVGWILVTLNNNGGLRSWV